MIPKTIHYIWLGGKRKPNLIQICINSWIEKLSDYRIIEWNETNLDLDKITKENRFFKKCREKNLWAYMADYLRLRILYEQGGIYFDTDIQVLKSLDSMLDTEAFIGMEAGNHIGTGVIGCEQYNPTIKRFLDFYQDEIWNSTLYVIPEILTFIIEKEKVNKITIYPQETFAPFSYETGYIEGCTTENTYCIHWFNAGWSDNKAVLTFLSVKHIRNQIIRGCVAWRHVVGYYLKRLGLWKHG